MLNYGPLGRWASFHTHIVLAPSLFNFAGPCRLAHHVKAVKRGLTGATAEHFSFSNSGPRSTSAFAGRSEALGVRESSQALASRPTELSGVRGTLRSRD